ncbi:hypothetical protein [Agrococcus sp. TSP3-2-1]|uniref:hypothetical protein n=1 Tax=Agrococcus sp. TSP3-2-1 TaxID=2804583 RepID=UPI003CEA9488
MDRGSPEFVLHDDVLPSDRVVLRGYLQLCEDEVDLRRTARVTDSSWLFWREAVLAQLREPAYRRELDEIDVERFPMLRMLEAQGASLDPLSRHWLWRKLHGL